MPKSSRKPAKKSPSSAVSSVPTESKQAVERYSDPSLKTLWVDSFAVAIRKDSMVILSFASLLPDAPVAIEVARLATPVEHLKRMVDVACRSLNYYPAPADTSKEA